MKLDHSVDSLEFVCKAVAKVLPSIGINKSCVSGTLFLVDVLREAGFTTAYPLTTGVCIENAARVDWVREFGEPVNEAMIEACNAAGGLTVNIGMANASEVGPDQWAGHLVVIIPAVRGRDYLIDLTIIQINDHGAFKLPPIFAEV